MLLAANATDTIECPLVGALVHEGPKRRAFTSLFTLPSTAEEVTGTPPPPTETRAFGQLAEASDSARRPGGVGGRLVHGRAES